MAEPVTLEQAKAQVRELADFEDDLIEQKIKAARVLVEGDTGLLLIRKQIIAEPHRTDRITTRLFHGPVVSIDLIEHQAPNLDFITYTAGFAEGEVSHNLIEAILVLVAGMLSEREGAYDQSLRAAESLCRQSRVMTL